MILVQIMLSEYGTNISMSYSTWETKNVQKLHSFKKVISNEGKNLLRSEKNHNIASCTVMFLLAALINC